MLKEDGSGYIISSRFQGNASDEIASLFHANREAKMGKDCNVTSLNIGNKTITSDKKIIKSKVYAYFNALFNGFHDTNMNNTGKSFVPNNSDLSYFLDRLVA